MKHIKTKITLITAAVVALLLFTTNENLGDQGEGTGWKVPEIRTIEMEIDTTINQGGGTGWKVPKIAKKIKNPLPSTKLALKLGEKLFAQNCETCHGETGIGDGPSAKFLGEKLPDLTSKSVQSQVDGVLFYKITKGRAPMPAFRTILSSKQRWTVIDYIRTLKSK